MKYTDNTIFYPDNRALERAIVASLSLLSEEEAALAIYRHTQMSRDLIGNQLVRAGILENS